MALISLSWCRNLRYRFTANKWIIVIGFFLFILVQHINPWTKINQIKHLRRIVNEDHISIIDRFYDQRKNWNTSTLGSMLFKTKFLSRQNQLNALKLREYMNKTYIIVVWRYYDRLKHRHTEMFGQSSSNSNPLGDCIVQNCYFTGNSGDISSADAVLIHLQKGTLPNETESRQRTSNQTWIFLTDEAPTHTFSVTKNNKSKDWENYADIFNWSMTYRVESDVPVPYGRTVTRPDALIKTSDLLSDPRFTRIIPFWDKKRKDVLVTILSSNCKAQRKIYVEKLNNYVKVDDYGSCSKNESRKKSCPGHFKQDCPVIEEYLFYLVFENSKCKEYITEKAFYNAYSKGAIPIIDGPPLEDCELLLPPNSFLHVDNFYTPWHLAEEIKRIVENNTLLLQYHEWRNHFMVLNEHGYFRTSSVHWCRICEALNYNSKKRKVYDKEMLRHFLDEERLCAGW